MTDLVQRLRQFRRTPIFAPAHEAADRIEQLETALAQCRDAMPQPAPGERPEQSWSESIGDPMAVPAYVKETMARLERENAELRKDAERYRWIRKNPYHFGHGTLQVFRDDRCDSGDYNKQVWGDALDAAADYGIERFK